MVPGVKWARSHFRLFSGTVGTSRQDAKGEIQIIKMMSVRVPMPGTGAELLVVVRRHL